MSIARTLTLGQRAFVELPFAVAPPSKDSGSSRLRSAIPSAKTRPASLGTLGLLGRLAVFPAFAVRRPALPSSTRTPSRAARRSSSGRLFCLNFAFYLNLGLPTREKATFEANRAPPRRFPSDSSVRFSFAATFSFHSEVVRVRPFRPADAARFAELNGVVGIAADARRQVRAQEKFFQNFSLDSAVLASVARSLTQSKATI